MQFEVSIIDYGSGNIFSLRKMLNKLGCKTIITKDPDKISNSKKIILPGVGGFESAISEIQKNNIFESIVYSSKKGSSIMGICLGMHILCNSSEEGKGSGFNFFKYEINKINLNDQNIMKYKIPNIGWHNIELLNHDNVNFLKDFKDDNKFYFCHSYVANFDKYKCEESDITTLNYPEKIITSLSFENIFGVQFHPELSKTNGEKIFNNFLSQ